VLKYDYQIFWKKAIIPCLPLCSRQVQLATTQHVGFFCCFVPLQNGGLGFTFKRTKTSAYEVSKLKPGDLTQVIDWRILRYFIISCLCVDLRWHLIKYAGQMREPCVVFSRVLIWTDMTRAGGFAATSGLINPGDLIHSVDGAPCQTMQQEEFARKLSGPVVGFA
jgi:hypothetical protein